MNRLNRELELLGAMVGVVKRDMEAVALVLDACPNCRVEHADVVKVLREQVEVMEGVIGAIAAVMPGGDGDGDGDGGDGCGDGGGGGDGDGCGDGGAGCDEVSGEAEGPEGASEGA